jgi:hypothetical protein
LSVIKIDFLAFLSAVLSPLPAAVVSRGMGRDDVQPLAYCAPRRKNSEDDFTGKRGIVVKAFLAACLASIVLAVIALIILDRVQEPADRAFTTTYTRVGD